MVAGDSVDLNLTMAPSSRKIPALLTKNSAQPCQIEGYREMMMMMMTITSHYHHYHYYYHYNHHHNR